jgi:hypothetical protein
MPTRPWSRLLLASLLLWQLNVAVASAGVYGAVAAQASGAPATHCNRHAAGGSDETRPATGDPAVPQAPDCCHDASAMCHCVQIPGLALPTLASGEVLPPDPLPVPRTAPRPQARGADFFRPPI